MSPVAAQSHSVGTSVYKEPASGPYTIAVIGSSRHKRHDLAIAAIESIPARNGDVAWGCLDVDWITGDNERGVDAWFRRWAIDNGSTFRTEWSELRGEEGGPTNRHSASIVEDADVVVIICWKKPSEDEARIAHAAINAGTPLVVLIHDEDTIEWTAPL